MISPPPLPPQQQHTRQPSFLPPNIIFAMIDGGSDDVNDYDQVMVSVQPPTIVIPIPSEHSGEDDGSDKSDLPPPPASLTSVVLGSPVSNGSHYQSIGTTEVQTVAKVIDRPKKGKCSPCCSFWCVMLWTVIIGLLVFGLVFFHKARFVNGGEDETSPQGNLTMTSQFTVSINYYDSSPSIITTSLALSPAVSTSTLTSSTPTTTPTVTSTSTIATTFTSIPPPTTTTTTTTRAYRSTTLTMPYGWNQPIKVKVNVTASAFSANSSSLSSSSATSSTRQQLLTTTTTFEEKDKNVFGNMSIFLSDKKKFVVSPFILNYILSFIGKFGDATTKSAILDNYFEANDINKMYDYFGNLKDDFYASKYQNPWFLLNAFISGDNPTKARFMEEIAEVDRIPVYPSSSERSYETYYNEMIKKNSYDKENYQKFFGSELEANPQKLVGFSHLQSSLKFHKVLYNRIESEEFHSDGGKTSNVNMFVTYSAYHDFEDHRLYQIPFTDDRYTFFIVHNRFNASVPNISLPKVLKAIKNGSENETTVCVPEIVQQNTYDISHFIDLSAGKELSLRTPFDEPMHNSVVDKYYQAIRFDVRAEGLNVKTREYEPFTYNCIPVDRTFIYGIFYNDKKNPGQEALLYYGLFV